MSPEYNGHNGHANGHTNGTAPHPIPDALSGRPKGTGSGGGYEPPAPTDRLAEFFAAGMPEAWAWEPRKRPGDKYAIESIEGFVPPDQVTELRILGVPTGNPDYPTARYSGFTDGNHAPWIWGQIKSYADRKAEGFYFVPNRVDPELLETKGRKHNIVKAGKDEATKDKSIVRRVKFYIDTDPKRISKHTGEELSGKHSATAEERAASFEKMRAVVEFTVSRGWPAPWRITDSGNGFHAYYNTDLPADDGGLIKRTLEALAARFDDGTVEVDVTVANAARVTKLYPSLVCKGEHSEDRPWRWAHTVFADNASPVLSADQLEMIARDAPQDDKPAVPAPAPEKATHRRATGGNRPGAEERYADWMACVPESIQGQHGSKQLVKAASGGHGFGLSEATAVDLLMKHFNPRCKPEWSEEEVKHAVANAYKNAEKPRGHLLEADREPARNGNGGNGKAGGKPEPTVVVPGDRPATFSNYELGEDEDGKPTREPLSIHDLDHSLGSIMGDWPKRVGDQLFAETPDHQKIALNSSTKLFAWINKEVHVDWTKGNEMVPQDRYYEHRRMNATPCDAIETLPHWPPIEGIYYMHEPVPDSTGGGLLDQLLNYFNPSSDVDRELIRAYILTLFWGGPPGSRPAFLTTGPDVDSEQGRGVGKSTIVELLANGLANGFLEVSPNVEMHKIDERLLSPGARQIRVVRIDNIKTDRFSWGDLEGRITSPVISGRELYSGEGRRPNTLVFNLTLNGASLSKDMAQRTIVIKLARPPKVAGWKESVVAFIKANRLGLLAEIRDALLDESGAFPAVTRWAEWERDVLTKTDDLNGCQKAILERQAEIDNDKEEQDIVADHFAERISGHGYDPKRACVQITAQAVADWLSKATGEIYSVKKATTHLKRLGIEQLAHKRKNTGVIWTWTAGPVDVNRPNGPIKW